MEDDFNVPLISKRPFLATRRALIDVQLGNLILKINDEQVCFNVLKTKHSSMFENCLKVDVTNLLLDKDVHDGIKCAPMEGLKDPPKTTTMGSNGKKEKAKCFDENLSCLQEKRPEFDAFENKPMVYNNAKRRMVRSG